MCVYCITLGILLTEQDNHFLHVFPEISMKNIMKSVLMRIIKFHYGITQ